jgi:hypothetical protein
MDCNSIFILISGCADFNQAVGNSSPIMRTFPRPMLRQEPFAGQADHQAVDLRQIWLFD